LEAIEKVIVNRGIGLLLMAFFLLFFLLIPWQISEQGVPPKSPIPVYPQFFPRIIAAFGFFLCLALFVKSFFTPGDSKEILDIPNKTNLLRIVLVILILCFYVLALNPLGYLVSTSLSLIFLMAFFGLREVRYFILIIAILPPAIYYLFKKLLYVPLPAGWLGF
jgi:putative tricarboxylic transport membrane protein